MVTVLVWIVCSLIWVANAVLEFIHHNTDAGVNALIIAVMSIVILMLYKAWEHESERR